MVSDAAATKAPIAKIADKVSGVFVPAVISHRACDVQLSGCSSDRPSATRWRAASPCSSSAARARSALPRRSPSWSAAASARRTASCSKRPLRWKKPAASQIVALDKTGTITQRRARSHGHSPGGGRHGGRAARAWPVRSKQKSEHPLAKAIMDARREIGVRPKRSRISGAARQRPDGRAGRQKLSAAAT